MSANAANATNLTDPFALSPSGPVPQKAVEKIRDGLRHGLSLRQACDLAGAPYAAVKAWMTVGEGDPLPMVEFRRLLRQAMAEVAYNDLQAISAATNSDWKAAAWRLTRLFRKRWGEESLRSASAPGVQISIDQQNTAVHGGAVSVANSWSAVLNVPQQLPASQQRTSPIGPTVDAHGYSPVPDLDDDPFAIA